MGTEYESGLRDENSGRSGEAVAKKLIDPLSHGVSRRPVMCQTKGPKQLSAPAHSFTKQSVLLLDAI